MAGNEPQFLRFLITHLPAPAQSYLVGGDERVVIPNKPLQSLLPEDFQYDFSGLNREKMLFCLVLYGYPNASADEIISWTRSKLSLSDAALMQVSTSMGRAEIIKRVQALFYNPKLLSSFFLREKVPPSFKVILADNKYQLFRDSAWNGNLDMLRWLKSCVTPNELKKMIKADNYGAFDNAAKGGHLQVLKWLKEQAPTEFLHMMQAFDYSAFRDAAAAGHLAVLKWMQEEVPDEFLTMVQKYNYHALYQAVTKKHHEVIQWFLEIPECFMHAEAHVREYGHIIHPHIQQLISSWRSQSLNSAPNPFSIAADEAKHGYYVLRNLIRRNEVNSHDDVVFLLSIPSIKALVHTEMTPGYANELIRLALRVGNESAALALLSIPRVRELAERYNYYREELQEGLDLSVLAQDRESSMHALSLGEQKRLKSANEHYLPALQNKGVPQIMEDLRQTLIAYYEKKPAVLLKDDGSNLNLPVAWDDFQQLILTAGEQERAMRAYYQNTNHSALRYLSKPNYWMHKEASYVYGDEPNHPHRWSSYIEYEPLIALFWLAAQDKEFPPVDAHTLEGRIEHFINELSLIGRAHNWDKTRPRKDKPHEMEEYDDLQGDRPSCYSGTKRRLFQSVIGHSLLNILSMEEIKQEIREFALAYFKRIIAELNNKNKLRAAFELYVSEVDDESAKPLSCLNISPQEQDQFLVYLHKKYGAQFAADFALIAMVQKELSTNPQSLSISERYHALKLDSLTHLLFYLQQEEKPEPLSTVKFFVPDESVGFFPGASACSSASNDQDITLDSSQRCL